MRRRLCIFHPLNGKFSTAHIFDVDFPLSVWLCRQIVVRIISGFLKHVDITFQALQQANAHLSQQMSNSERLLLNVVSQCGADVDHEMNDLRDKSKVIPTSSLKIGPFTVNAITMKANVYSLNTWAMEDFDTLSTMQMSGILCAMAFLYLTALNGLIKIKCDVTDVLYANIHLYVNLFVR